MLYTRQSFTPNYHKYYTKGCKIHFFWYNYNVEAHFWGLLCILGVKIVLYFYKVLLRKAQSLTPTIGFFQKIRIIYIERENKNVLGYLLRGTPLYINNLNHFNLSFSFFWGCQCAKRILPPPKKYNPQIDNN